MTAIAGEGTVRLPGEGQTTSLFGDTYVVKAGGAQTGGTLAVIQADLAPEAPERRCTSTRARTRTTT